MTGWLFDLDGVVYTGQAEIPGAGAALNELAAHSPIAFVTN
ncbi:haloacid dehalogenase, partial [Brevibacterium paucivorans]